MTTYVSRYPPAYSGAYVKATGYFNYQYYPHLACNPALSLIGWTDNTSWMVSASGSQKFNIDLGAATRIRRVRIDNNHENGGVTNIGIKDCILYGSNTAAVLSDTTYASLSNLVEIASFQVAAHVSSNVADPQYFEFDNETEYQYYVLRIANNWGSSNIGIRRIELQEDVDWTPPDSSVVIAETTLSQPFELRRKVLTSTFSQPFGLLAKITQTFSQPFALRIGRTLSQPFAPAAALSTTLHQYFGSCKIAGRTISHPFGQAVKIGRRLSQLFIVRAGLSLNLSQPFSVLQTKLEATLYQLFSTGTARKISSTLSQPFNIIDGNPLTQHFVITVTAGGVAVYPDEITINSEHGFPLTARLRLPDVLDFVACGIDAELIVNDGEEYRFVITSKSEQDDLGNNNYIVVGESESVALDDELLLEEFGPGVVSDLAVALAARYSVTLDWQSVPGWPFPAGTLTANDQTAFEILRQVAESVGAVLQPGPDGVLTIEPGCRFPTNTWDTCPVDFEINDRDHIFTLDDSPDLRDGYNSFLISGQGASGLRYSVDEIDISGDKKEYRCYIVPWHDRPIVLKHSGGAWVTIEKMGVKTIPVTDELVEIVGGVGNCRKPIYQLTGLRYREFYLGAVSFTEEGEISTAIDGESLLEVSYVTKYHSWLATNPVDDEPVQFWGEEA